MPQPLRLLALALFGSFLLGTLALAAAPPAKEGTDSEAASKIPQAIAAVPVLGQTLRSMEQHNQANAAAMAQAQAQPQSQSQGKPAPSAPAQKAGGGKVIYGDIIIHK